MYALKVNMRRLNLVPGRARTKHRFQKLSSCKPHHATKSSKIRDVHIALQRLAAAYVADDFLDEADDGTAQCGCADPHERPDQR